MSRVRASAHSASLEHAVGERGGHEDAHADAPCCPPGRAPTSAGWRRPALATTNSTIWPDAHHAVGARRTAARVSSKASGTHSAATSSAGHRAEDRQPHDALLGVDDAGQPRVADPRPPQHAEDQQPAGHALPGRVVGHQRRALRQREHEDEVEEQLERGDRLLVAQDRGQARRPAGCRGLHHAGTGGKRPRIHSGPAGSRVCGRPLTRQVLARPHADREVALDRVVLVVLLDQRVHVRRSPSARPARASGARSPRGRRRTPRAAGRSGARGASAWRRSSASMSRSRCMKRGMTAPRM